MSQLGQAARTSEATAVPWLLVLSSWASFGSGAPPTTFVPGSTAPASAPTGLTPVSTTATVWWVHGPAEASAAGTPIWASAWSVVGGGGWVAVGTGFAVIVGVGVPVGPLGWPGSSPTVGGAVAVGSTVGDVVSVGSAGDGVSVESAPVGSSPVGSSSTGPPSTGPPSTGPPSTGPPSTDSRWSTSTNDTPCWSRS